MAALEIIGLDEAAPQLRAPGSRATAAGDVTFSATNGSSTITVTDTAHGAAIYDTVTFSGATSLGGNITAAVLNQTYLISGITDANTYTIEALSGTGAATAPVANASDTGNGGASVVGTYIDQYASPRDHYMGTQKVTALDRMVFRGPGADITVEQDEPYIAIKGSQGYDYDASTASSVCRPAIKVTTENEIKGKAHVFGSGFLFWHAATYKNESGEAKEFGPFYTVVAAPTIEGHGAGGDITSFFNLIPHVDFFGDSAFRGVDSGTVDLPYTQFWARGRIDDGATVNSRIAFLADSMSDLSGSQAGSVTKEAGFVADLGEYDGDIHTNFLGGTDTVPSDRSYNMHQSDENVNLWNGGQEFKVDVLTGTSHTLDDSHEYVEITNNGTVNLTLPRADAGTKHYAIKYTGTGTLNIRRATTPGTDTMDGTSAAILKTITTQYHLLDIISDGSGEWLKYHDGAP